MTIDKQLEFLQSYIGKEFQASPSPFMRWLKPEVLAAEWGKLTFRYKVRPEMINSIGILHGGVTAAIMDDIAGATMYTFNEPYFYTTVNNVIDYFAPARESESLIAETSMIRKGSRMVNVQCEIWNGDRTKLLARGTSNLLKTEIAK
jgi:acyl-coenzyme A thioesterase 13